MYALMVGVGFWCGPFRYFAEASPADRSKLLASALSIASKLLLAVEPFADFAHALKRSQGES